MSCSPIDRLAQQIAELIVVRASGHLSDPQRRYPRWGTQQRNPGTSPASGRWGRDPFGGKRCGITAAN